jgi:small-conductance mechanosensitive channel/CRP-like cAMP-binding protein
VRQDEIRTSRVFAPLLLSAALFILYWVVKVEPGLFFRHPDFRFVIFGPELKGLLLTAWIPLIFVLVRLVDRLVFDVFVARRKNMRAPLLLRQMFAIVGYFLLFGWTISAIYHTSLTAWLTTTTVLAAVVGLALQDTLGNLFAGIAIHLEDAFDLGDVIHSGDYVGVVEGVTWRATRIRAFSNQVVILPNSQMSKDRIEVFPRNNLNGRVLTFGVDYHVKPATVIEVLEQAAAHVDGLARDMPAFARVAGFADSSVQYELKYFTRDYSMRDRIDAEIRKAVWYAFQRNEISFATPIRAYAPYTPPKTQVHLTPEQMLTRLREVQIFDPLSGEARTILSNTARVHFYSKGESILRHGAAGDSMFVVHEGTVSVRIGDDSPMGWHEVAQLGPGSVFGEMALLTGEARAADVAALTDVVSFEISKDALGPILRDHPDLAKAISAKVMERRDHLDELRNANVEDEEMSLLERIRNYFGL